MSAFDYFLAGWLLLSAMVTISSVGRPRKPLEPAAAAIAVAIQLGILTWLLVSRGVLG